MKAPSYVWLVLQATATQAASGIQQKAHLSILNIDILRISRCSADGTLARVVFDFVHVSRLMLATGQLEPKSASL